MKLHRLVVGCVMLLAVLLCNITGAVLAGSSRLENGQPAPKFSLPDLNGQLYGLDEVAANSEYVVLLFWGVWCPFCREIMVRLRNVYAEMHHLGLEIITISMRENPHKVRLFVTKLQPDYLVLVDEWATLQEPYAIRDVPRIVILNSDLTVLATRITTSMPIMEEMIRKVVLSSSDEDADTREEHTR